MIEELGMWVIEEASCQLRTWKASFGSTVPIAVNVSPLQLKSSGFAQAALDKIRGCGADPGCLEFEITERAVLNFTEAQEPMQQLAREGIVFAVDDFGTGYSSLQHLHRLPISVLKIDRYFINRLGAQRDADAIVEAIVSMAHALGMNVVAEGVETQEQRDIATSMGCDTIQGFLHSAAVDALHVPQLMGWP
jgi:EAL domain-containing protein (putative c-di-GMP-specific phosphodiesterase class I)